MSRWTHLHVGGRGMHYDAHGRVIEIYRRDRVCKFRPLLHDSSKRSSSRSQNDCRLTVNACWLEGVAYTIVAVCALSIPLIRTLTTAPGLQFKTHSQSKYRIVYTAGRTLVHARSGVDIYTALTTINQCIHFVTGPIDKRF